MKMSDDCLRLIRENGLEVDANTLAALKRICAIDFANIFRYRTLDEANVLCEEINRIKGHSTLSFKPFLSSSTQTLCHSMGNPLRVAEDVIEVEEKKDVLNSMLRIVNYVSSRYALHASKAAISGQCVMPEYNFVFDEDQQSYRKEVAHMSRYFRLHAGSYIAVEYARHLDKYPKNVLYAENAFSSVIELYEKGVADYVFNMVHEDDVREKLVTPILLDTKFGKVLGIHVHGHEKIRLWKRWGDPYSELRNMSDGSESDVKMDLTPFAHSVAIV
jgi:hypothetical protein